MRSGTVVGSFKIDLKTVYDASGTDNDEISIISYFDSLNLFVFMSLCLFFDGFLLFFLGWHEHVACWRDDNIDEQIDFFLEKSAKYIFNLFVVGKILYDDEDEHDKKERKNVFQ